MRRFISLICFIGLIAPMGATVFATDFSSSNFTVKDPVIEGLAGFSTSTSYQLWGSIPYISPVNGSSSSFGILPGFLNFPGATATSSTPTSTSPSGGGGGGGAAPLPQKEKPPKEVLRALDCNNDGRINLVDLSCLLYYTDKTGAIIKSHDLNEDGAVDLVDISILLYYWYDPT